MNAEILNTDINEVRLAGTVKNNFFNKLQDFDKIILRGAGSFGTEIGRRLLEQGISINKLLYWDIRAEELNYIHGIEVALPFSQGGNDEATLIIHCIPNGSLTGSTISAEMHQHGYNNIIDGMALFEAAFCLMNPDEGYDSKNCLNTELCNWTNCERLLAYCERDRGNVKQKQQDDVISFQVMDIILSTKCTLGCHDCGAHMNVYAEQGSAQHIPYEQIEHDVNIFFDNVDTVAFVSVIGGEPFIYPEFNAVVSLLLEKPNFGVLGVTTSGICKISEENLKVLKNNRTRVIFSDYTDALTTQQKKLFNENVKKVRDFGIHYTVGKPVWATAPSLKHKSLSSTQLQSMKENCNSVKTCQAIQNGRLYPCSTSLAVNELNIDEYSNDFVSLESNNLRNELRELKDRPYYDSCSRCTDGGQPVAMSGVQGRNNRFDHIFEGISIAVE